jgi:hypothetical protein
LDIGEIGCAIAVQVDGELVSQFVGDIVFA